VAKLLGHVTSCGRVTLQWHAVQLELEAQDRGVPPRSSRVRMDIDITQTSNSYPQWSQDYTAIVARISESAPVNTVNYLLLLCSAAKL